MRYSVLILIFLGAMACNGKRKLPPALFKLLSPQETGLDFVNQVVPNDSLNILFFNYFYNGGGVAIGDVNNDGLPDIYLAGNMVSSRLYLNQGNLRFEDITMPAGVGTAGHWATGVTMIDLNHDGLQDIYVCLSAHPDPALRANKLFINQGIDQGGRPVFQEMATQCGLADSGYSTQAAFFDYDRDGDLDVYLLSVGQDSLNPNIPRPKKMNGSAPSTDRLFRNNDDGTGGRLSFTNVSKPAGIVAEGFGLGVAISDFDLDGWPDIFVANDFIYNDLLYLNNRNGTFTEAAQRGFKHQSRFSMGTDAADFNNDTLTDLAVLDMWPPDNQRQKLMNMGMNYDLFLLALDRGYIPQYVRNMLHLNNGNGTFSEIGQLAGIDKTDWSWSALWADYDNDGFKDLFVTNGIPKDITDSDFVLYRDANAGEAADTKVFTKKLLAMVEQLPAVRKHSYLFKNQGNFTFTDFSAQAGFSTPTCSNGAAYADLDNDGDVDLVVNNLGDPAFIYENTAAKTLKNKVLQIKLVGSKLNPDGIGAKVNVYTGPIIQQYAQWRTRGFQSSVGQVLNVGLGTAAQADSLEVIWPDGKKQVLRDVNPLRPIILDYRLAGAHWPQPVPRPTLFTQAAGFYGIAHRHEENPFIDFKQEPLLPHKLSQQSPALAVGDVNGDGLQDFCVGSAARRPAMLFTQSRLGKFTASELPDSLFEDGGMLLFDADQDGDNDLYVVSAGNEFNANTRPYQDRFYRNDGKGKFVIDEQALPPLMASGSCVIAADYDRDGDLDLFVGGSHVPGQYGPVRPACHFGS